MGHEYTDIVELGKTAANRVQLISIGFISRPVGDFFGGRNPLEIEHDGNVSEHELHLAVRRSDPTTQINTFVNERLLLGCQHYRLQRIHSLAACSNGQCARSRAK
jgi:hypothetical protein